MKTDLLRVVYANDRFINEQWNEDNQSNKIIGEADMDDRNDLVVGKIYMKYKRQSWLRLILFTVLFIAIPLGYFIAEKSFNYVGNYGML